MNSYTHWEYSFDTVHDGYNVHIVQTITLTSANGVLEFLLDKQATYANNGLLDGGTDLAGFLDGHTCYALREYFRIRNDGTGSQLFPDDQLNLTVQQIINLFNAWWSQLHPRPAANPTTSPSPSPSSSH